MERSQVHCLPEAAAQARPIGFASLVKRRSLGKVSGQDAVCGEVRHAQVLLIDDLIVSGTTLARAAQALYAAGAASVCAIVIRDLRSPGTLARLAEAGISRLFASDSLPAPEDPTAASLPIVLHRISCLPALLELARSALDGEG